MTPPRAATALVEELRRLHRETLELAYVRRADGIDRIDDALRGLDEVGSPAGILARSAAAFAGAADVDLVLVSRVDGDRLWPIACHAMEADAMAVLERGPLPLAYPLVEAEIAQRRDGSLVSLQRSGHRAAPDLAEIFGWTRYAVVPIRLDGTTLGLLHAARPGALDELDLELATRFAVGLARVFACAVLREQVRRRRDQLEVAGRWVNAQLVGLTAEAEPGLTPTLPGDDRQLGELLTRRELEVLRLIARGLTNRAIATTLTLGEGTVKYHVKHILRKLGARSRAEAVSHYLRRYSGPDEP